MSESLEFDNDGVEQVSLKQYAEKAYLDYSMYVILDRALPHVGDGMKPVLLFCVSFGLFSGAVSTGFWLVVFWETYKRDAKAFAELMKDPEIKEAIEQAQGMGGKSLSQALADGDVSVDEDGNLVDKDGNPVTVVPGNGMGEMDSHDGWDDDLSHGQVTRWHRRRMHRHDLKGKDGGGGRGRGREREGTRRQRVPQTLLQTPCTNTSNQRRGGREEGERRGVAGQDTR